MRPAPRRYRQRHDIPGSHAPRASLECSCGRDLIFTRAENPAAALPAGFGGFWLGRAKGGQRSCMIRFWRFTGIGSPASMLETTGSQDPAPDLNTRCSALAGINWWECSTSRVPYFSTSPQRTVEPPPTANQGGIPNSTRTM